MSFRRRCDFMASHRRKYDVVLACLFGIFIIFVINTFVVKKKLKKNLHKSEIIEIQDNKINIKACYRPKSTE